ncbi:uncharacterized protein LOC132726777 [Ruditapes philippinarum]|uniref:uncharacterized protein LOC132726777 n=1 Tax=Ruditapes philippinarum TaxID=129788 RepID=UPI00295A8897|nr:uncharacterized protein LOC132726777 [Ruditapes philippinarum]
MDVKLTIVLCVCLWLANACEKSSPKRSDGRGPIRYPSYKRSVKDEEINIQWDGYHYHIKLDGSCRFNTYDTDRDGTISREELFDILGSHEVTEALFKDLDVMKGLESYVMGRLRPWNSKPQSLKSYPDVNSSQMNVNSD